MTLHLEHRVLTTGPLWKSLFYLYLFFSGFLGLHCYTQAFSSFGE